MRGMVFMFCVLELRQTMAQTSDFFPLCNICLTKSLHSLELEISEKARKTGKIIIFFPPFICYGNHVKLFFQFIFQVQRRKCIHFRLELISIGELRELIAFLYL